MTNYDKLISYLPSIYQKENNLKSIPISALTANAIKGDKEKFLDLGMDYYLSKPISVAKLKELFTIYLLNKLTIGDYGLEMRFILKILK